MDADGGGALEGLAADVADVRPLVRVHLPVEDQLRVVLEDLSTRLARVLGQVREPVDTVVIHRAAHLCGSRQPTSAATSLSFRPAPARCFIELETPDPLLLHAFPPIPITSNHTKYLVGSSADITFINELSMKIRRQSHCTLRPIPKVRLHSKVNTKKTFKTPLIEMFPNNKTITGFPVKSVINSVQRR